jgi:hypothetical protein
MLFSVTRYAILLQHYFLSRGLETRNAKFPNMPNTVPKTFLRHGHHLSIHPNGTNNIHLVVESSPTKCLRYPLGPRGMRF